MRSAITPAIAKLAFVMSFAFASLPGYNQCTVITPGPVTGDANMCLYAYFGTTQQLTYSIDPLPMEDSYEWDVQPNVDIVPLQGTTALTIIPNSIQTGRIDTDEIPAGSDIMILHVSPNPSSGDFKVNVSSNVNADIRVRLIDISGRVLKRLAIKRNEAIFFGSDLRPGNYILEVIQGKTRRIQKLVKL